MVGEALAELGPDTPVAFPNTAYYLPVVYAITGTQGREARRPARASLAHAKGCCTPCRPSSMWLPYLGETLDSGMATLFAEEAIEGVRFARSRSRRSSSSSTPARTASASPAATSWCTATR